MADQKDLQIVVTAVDNASKELKNVQTSLDNFGNAATQAGAKNQNMTASIFSGLVTYDLFKRAIGGVTDFVKGAVTAYMDQEKSLLALKGAIQGTGVSFNEAAPAIKDVTENNIKLGITDNQTSQSLAVLTTYTGDYKKALEEQKIVQEMAIYNFMTGRSATIDMQQATEQLSKVQVGGTRALKEYGINIKDVNTMGEAMVEIHKKMSPVVAEFSDTAASKGLQLKAQWDELNETMGKNFSQSVLQAQAALGQLAADPSTRNFFEQTSKYIGDLMTGMTQAATGSILTIVDFVKSGLGVINDLGATAGRIFYDVFHPNYWGDIKNDFKSGYDNLIKIAGDFQNKVTQDWKNVATGSNNATTTLGKNTTDTKKLMQDFTDAIGTAGSSAQSQADKLGVKFDELQTKIKDFATSTQNDLNTVAKSIADTLDKINQLDVTQSKNTVDLNQQYADAYVQQEQTIADLQKAVNEKSLAVSSSMISAGGITAAQQDPTYQKNKDELEQAQRDLAKAQDDLAKYKTVAIIYSNEIAATEKRNAESKFQQTMDDLQLKQTTTFQEYTANKTKLQNELIDEQNKWVSIKKIQDDALKQTQKFLKDDEKQTLDSVNNEISYYNQLAKAVADAKKAVATASIPIPTISQTKTTAPATTTASSQLTALSIGMVSGAIIQQSQVATTPVKAKAIGGPVTGQTPYLIGERGPELFVPQTSGRIVPNNQLGGIHITITGNTLLDSRAAEKIGDLIIKKLGMSTKYAY